jgi:hypothetical protein
MLTACSVCHRFLVKPNENIIRRILDLLDKEPVPIPKVGGFVLVVARYTVGSCDTG